MREEILSCINSAYTQILQLEDTLMESCEFPKINQALQRVLDMKLEVEAIRQEIINESL